MDYLNPVIQDLHYILSKLFRVSYAETVVLYNQFKERGSYSISDEKIIDIANMLRQKENDKDEQSDTDQIRNGSEG